VRYRSLFSGAAVERVQQLQFHRPLAEIELSPADARAAGVWTGHTVTVSSNGTARQLGVKVNRRLMQGVARVTDEHARGLGPVVEVAKA
jgi:predicted molibdopterin-dependent oxidoreductase YjgC